MSLYPRGRYEHGVSKKTFEYAIIAIVLLGLLSLFLIVRSVTSTTTDTDLSGVLTAQLRAEEESARLSAAQLSRYGGSTTMHLLAVTRQHVYAMSQLNTLGISLLGGPLLPQALLDEALATLTACESLLHGGGTMDAQIATLWEQITAIQAHVAAM